MDLLCILTFLFSKLTISENQNHSEVFEDSLLQDFQDFQEIEHLKKQNNGGHFMDTHFDTSYYTDYYQGE